MQSCITAANNIVRRQILCKIQPLVIMPFLQANPPPPSIYECLYNRYIMYIIACNEANSTDNGENRSTKQGLYTVGSSDVRSSQK